MCGYSLSAEQTRQAIEGEQLVMTRFSHTRGFASPKDPQTAVCLKNGTRLALSGIPEATQRVVGLQSSDVDAVFVEKPLSTEPFYRWNQDAQTDWLRIGEQEISLLNLPIGVMADVLPAVEIREPEGIHAMQEVLVRV